MDIPLTYLIAGGLCIGYVVLLVIAWRNKAQLEGLQQWLVATLVVAFGSLDCLTLYYSFQRYCSILRRTMLYQITFDLLIDQLID